MTTAQLAATRLNLNEARCEALFASGLQPSDAPTADMVADAINYTVQQVGISGCVGQMAQEFGDHPDAAAERMRWARQFAAWAGVRLQDGLRAEPRSQVHGASVADISNRPAASDRPRKTARRPSCVPGDDAESRTRHVIGADLQSGRLTVWPETTSFTCAHCAIQLPTALSAQR
jgi:hypothetical protein